MLSRDVPLIAPEITRAALHGATADLFLKD